MIGEAESKAKALAARYNLPEQPEWQQFLNHFDLSESFALVVLLVVDADGAELCREDLEKHLQHEGKKLLSLDLSTPENLRILAASLLDATLPADVGALWIAAVEPDYSKNLPVWKEAWQTALIRLNPRRNEIRRQFNCSLVFVGAPWLQEVMREIAPDIWSVRTLVARIEPAPAALSGVFERVSSEFAETQTGGDPQFALAEAEKLRGIPGKELALARLLHRAGEGFESRNDSRSAEKYYTEALELKQKAGAPPESLLATLLNLSRTYDALSQPMRAIDFAETSLNLARQIYDRQAEGRALSNLGNAHAVLGNARKALGLYDQALAIARAIGDRDGEGASLGNLGVVYADLGEARKAIEFHEQRLMIARAFGDRRGESNALGNLGLAYADLGELRKAVSFYLEQLRIVREIGHRRGECNALSNLGLAHYELGDCRKAIELHNQALTISRELGDRRGEGQDLGNLGLAYARSGGTRAAIEFYERALEIARDTGDQYGVGNVLGNLGNAYADLGDARKAISFYDQQLKVVHEIGFRRGEGNALWNSALLLDELGERGKAIDRAEAALKIFEAIEAPKAASVRATLTEWRGQ